MSADSRKLLGRHRPGHLRELLDDAWELVVAGGGGRPRGCTREQPVQRGAVAGGEAGRGGAIPCCWFFPHTRVSRTGGGGKEAPVEASTAGEVGGSGGVEVWISI